VTPTAIAYAATLAVVGVGIEPRVPPFAPTIAQANGVLVERAVSARALTDVHAAGYVAKPSCTRSSDELSVEHFNNAKTQGPVRRRGQFSAPPPRMTTSTAFWSDQYEHKLEVRRPCHEVGRLRCPGSTEGGRLIAFYRWRDCCRPPSGLDRGGDPELDTDAEMAACARLVAMGARPCRVISWPTSVGTCGRSPATRRCRPG